MVKAPHCVEDAWKFPFSTWRYRVLTVCERRRLNKATFVPLAMHTVNEFKDFLVQKVDSYFVLWRHLPKLGQLTICIFERLLLFRWFWYHFDSLTMEKSYILSITVEHFNREHEMLPFVRVWYVQGFGRTVLLQRYGKKYENSKLFRLFHNCQDHKDGLAGGKYLAIQIQLLVILVSVTNANEGTELRALLTFSIL